jgi:hypothetical protein
MKSVQYRRYARECLQLAQQAVDETDRAVLLQMAEMWRRLAERHEARTAGECRDDGKSAKGCLP